MGAQDSKQPKVVGGKYHLLRQVGEGGMAIVWRAEMRGAAGFTRPVAIKKMRPELMRGQVYAAMFVEEARMGAELAHPNIVQVFDFCQDDDGVYCLVMEWVEGMDLRAFNAFYRRHGQPVPWPIVVAIGAGALRGLAAAHERVDLTGAAAPVIHRDVSPSNIMLGVNGLVKLADFGLARARDRLHSLTAPGIVKGKIGYLAPEIVRGDPLSVQSDLFSMGVVLWETLAGRPLYTGATDADVLYKVNKAEVTPLDRERSGLPPRLGHVIHQALQANPAARFPSARAMAQALVSVLAQAREVGDTQVLLSKAVTHIHARGPALPNETIQLSLTDIEPQSR